jgi:hypothetical protein
MVPAQSGDDAAAVLAAPLTPAIGEQVDDLQAPAVFRRLLAVSGACSYCDLDDHASYSHGDRRQAAGMPSRALPADLRPGVVCVEQERRHDGGEAGGVFPEQQVTQPGEGDQAGTGDAAG